MTEQSSEIESTKIDNPALTAPPLSTFIKYVLPAFVGLIAMSSASIVDGIFIGNFVGAQALAAVNLTMPFLSLMFGFAIMLTMGGSVRAGKYIGEENLTAASAIFSKTLIAVLALGALVASFGLIFSEYFFAAFGANEALFPLMADYFYILIPFLVPQLATVVLYFFVRIDGYPNLAAIALTGGAVLNIFLDWLFIAYLDLGLKGAALATGISQLIPAIVLASFFFLPKRKLQFSMQQDNWKEVFQAAFNGISEFINEISAGVITFILNWLLMLRIGVDGVAAITVINYLLMIGLMLFFAVADASQVLISQNFGAKLVARIKQLFSIAIGIAIGAGLLCVSLLLGFTDSLVNMFLDSESQNAAELAKGFVWVLWPIFLANGINVVITSYLTALHLPIQSGLVAISRSLVLPALLLLLFFWLFPQSEFLWALPVAEVLTLLIAGTMFWLHRPSLAVLDKESEKKQEKIQS